MNLDYFTVNAFTDHAFAGAPILVFPQAGDIDESTMQKLAEEFGLPDTVFITETKAAGCDVQFRYFQKGEPALFEGHATIGAAAVWHHINQESTATPASALTIQAGESQVHASFSETLEHVVIAEYRVDTNSNFDTYVPSEAELSRIFGLDPKSFQVDEFSPLVVLCDKSYLIIPVRHPDMLLQARFSSAAWVNTPATSTMPREMLVFAHAGTEQGRPEYHAQLFGESIPTEEDPAIASAMPAFASYLHHSGQTDSNIVVKRGVGKKRLSELNVQFEAKENDTASITVGGSVTLVSRGKLLV